MLEGNKNNGKENKAYKNGRKSQQLRLALEEVLKQGALTREVTCEEGIEVSVSFCILTASAGASTGQEPESLCLYTGSVISVHRRGTSTLRTTLSSAAEARSMLAPFQLSLSTVSVADSIVGNALSS